MARSVVYGGFAVILLLGASCARKCEVLATSQQVLASGIGLRTELKSCSDQQRSVVFTIVNDSSRSVTFLAPSLPWQTTRSAGLNVINASTGEVLQAVHPIADAPPERVIVKPHGTIVGTVLLDQLFPGITAIPDSQVAITWHVRLETDDRRLFEASGGPLAANRGSAR